MKIVIAGAGEVGSHLARLLSREKQDVILIDNNAERLAILDADNNLMTLKGRPISFKTQKSSGADQCDLFIAVTPDETQNVLACSMAKSIGAKKHWQELTIMNFWTATTVIILCGSGSTPLFIQSILLPMKLLQPYTATG